MTEQEKQATDELLPMESEYGNKSADVEKIYAWKELLSSPEAKEFVNTTILRIAELFGQTKGAKITQAITNVAVMVVAFLCIGTLASMQLISEGTTGVLAGIIIGYFFKQEK